MRYRSDIDGLRAVAVIPVVLFHAGLPGFGGGFVGVDVFFVISGYLITSLIADDLSTGTFSIAKFYERRIRRIFPALIVVLLFVLFVGYFLFTPDDYRSLGSSVDATILFLSNMFFWQQVGYFDSASSLKPLLHTWSLSIEEQFYAVYPLLLLLLRRFSHQTKLIVLVSTFLISFVAAAAMVFYKPSAAFYLGPFRAWELLGGGLVALGLLPNRATNAARQICAVLGLLLVLLPEVFYSATTRFPGLTAAPPVLGTMLIIWTGGLGSTIVRKLLSSPPLTSIGKASYSLYLWHFPIFAFSHYVTIGKINFLNSIALCIASVVISFASLYVVERPFRRKSSPRTTARLVSTAVGAMACVAMIGVYVVTNDGLRGRFDLQTITLLDTERENTAHAMKCMSLGDKLIAPQDACRYGASGVRPSVLLWGDSHSAVTATAISDAAHRHGAAFLYAGSVDCPPGLGFDIASDHGPGFVSTPGYQYCGEYNGAMLRSAVSSEHIKTVVISARWTNWRIGEPGSPAEGPVDIRLRNSLGTAQTLDGNKQIFAEGFEKLVMALLDAGKVVWVVGPVPEPSVVVPRALYVQHLGLDRSDFDIPESVFFTKNKWILAYWQNLSEKYPIRFVWPHSVLCSKGTCKVSDNGAPLYFDHNHLSKAGILKTSPLYDDLFSD
uniref:Acyltransferase n=1 Tax=Rhodopseudomonas palustris (strain BisA53) TaxID=316055 RepID=Q07SJ4_RHOP5